MIFVTVGEQLPFDRLIRTMDDWAAISGREIFAQIGRSDLMPVHIAYKKFLTPEEFKCKCLSAEIIIAHAGMGTIISALEMNKPILVMPRQAALGEHRNDHQFATAKRFIALNYITVAFDGEELVQKLERLDDVVSDHKGGKQIGPSELLIKTIKSFIAAI